MKRTILYTLLVGVLCAGNTPVARAETPTLPNNSILITEIQTGGVKDATEEFVEIYNPHDEPIDITGWQLQYRAASNTPTQPWANSSTKATIACSTENTAPCRIEVAAKQRAVITHTLTNIAGALPMSGGFSATGGQIRLIEPGVSPIVHDLVGYGNAATSETAPASAPPSGKSIKRVIDVNNEPIDTNNNASDFIVGCGEPTPGLADSIITPLETGCTAEPETSPEAPVIEPTTPTETATEASEPVAIVDTQTFLPVIITEVFADPESPQQDSTDEFIELYNPNDAALTLKKLPFADR